MRTRPNVDPGAIISKGEQDATRLGAADVCLRMQT